ncbi:phage tail protein [Pseudomonas veronii]|uniref:phage tail-collar fiber domain-containing protein n=1 Tax=Pseudomonas veronii TaxID=76761 RepID=UPI00143DF758|nr:phage tail protein [Pseudomonas veronii]
MIDQNSQFFAILTSVGEAKQANATALGQPWTFAQMGVGDANGADPIPNRTQTRLINEWRRAAVNQVRTDPANPNIIITEQVIPADVGGKWIREIALYDADGDMVAVANCAPSFKPLLVQGTGKTQIIRMNFIVANTASVVLKIDPAIVLATREYVDTQIVEAMAKMDFKHSVLVATTANIALSGVQTIDGVLLPADARVLVKNQTASKENGLYVVSSTGVWKRAQDADSSVEVTPGLFVSVEAGTVNGDSVWQLVTDAPIVLGTTALAFEMAVGRTGVSAGSYANVTVDKYGRVIAGTNPTTLEGHGITDAYTKDQIAAMIAQASALPVGSTIGFPVDKVAPGFLELDGSVKSVATYPDLATFLGGAFNKGDEGAGNFRLPESRGEFLRGWDHGRGVDAGRAMGSYQLDAIQNIVGTFAAKAVGNTDPLKPTGPFAAKDGTGISGGSNDAVAPGVEQFKFDASLAVRTSTETRGRNFAVMWCIKAWNAPINQGNIDVAALEAEVARMRSLVITNTHKKLSVSTTGASGVVSLKAEKLIIGSGVAAKAVTQVDLSVNMAASGLGGLDTGVVAASSCYGIWVATNGVNTAATAALMPVLPGAITLGSPIITGLPNTASMRVGMQFCSAFFPWGVTIKSIDSASQITANQSALATVATDYLRFVYEPVLPAGYVASRFSALFTDATASKFPLAYMQVDKWILYRPGAGTNVVNLPLLASGVQGATAQPPTFVPVAVGALVPPTASKVKLTVWGHVGNTSVIAAPNPAHHGITNVPAGASPLHISDSAAAHNAETGDITLERGYMYYASGATYAGLACNGYEDNI